jgi:hypothetical protein
MNDNPLTVAQDSRSCRASKRHVAVLLIVLICGSGILVALPAIWACATYGSIGCFLAKQRGDVVFVGPSHELHCSAKFPECARRTFRLTNLTNRSITVVGANVSCGCLHVEGLPMALDPLVESSVVATITPTPRDRGTRVRQSATLLLNIDGPRPTLALTGNFTE